MEQILADKSDVLERKVFAEKNRIELTVEGDADYAKADIGFLFSVQTKDDIAEFCRMADPIWKEGLVLMAAYASHPEEEGKAVQPDDILGGLEGYFSSTLQVEDGRIIYELQLCSLGSDGELFFDFGPAVPERCEKITKIISHFEKKLVTFTYAVKHNFIEADWDE